jgi:hypothetical protein
MKFDRCLIAFDDQMLNVKLRATRQDLPQLGRCAFHEGLLAQVVVGHSVRAHNCPVNVVCYMLEKGGAIAGLKPVEAFENALACNGHPDIVFHLPVTSRITRR